jgi:general stress protein 26
MMKIISASSEIPSMNSIEGVEIALGKKLNLQLATIDKIGYPNIQPVWFVYDKEKEKLYILTSSRATKTLNIRNNSKVYFSVDDNNVPYKGVKGRGIATILDKL